MTEYEAIIGLEIHAELLTAAKMFSAAPVVDSVTAEPNTAVHPLCLGMPDTLPVINKQAVDYALRVALALNCHINQHNIFARKNYFYPDLPKGYQISQYEEPIGVKGWLDVELEDGTHKRIGIRRVHMEEDTGNLTHQDDGTSLVDYNRAGVPLLEIVSEGGNPQSLSKWLINDLFRLMNEHKQSIEQIRVTRVGCLGYKPVKVSCWLCSWRRTTNLSQKFKRQARYQLAESRVKRIAYSHIQYVIRNITKE